MMTKLDLGRVHDAMHTPRIVDTRNLFDPVAVRNLGFDYVGLGNP